MHDEAFWLSHPDDESAEFGAIIRFDSGSRVAYFTARAPAGLLLELLREDGADSITAFLEAEAVFDSLVAGFGESVGEAGDSPDVSDEQ